MRYYFAFKMGKKKIISYYKRLCVFFVAFRRLTAYLKYIHKHFQLMGVFSQNTKILFVFPPKLCISIVFNFSWNDFDTFLFQAVIPRGSDCLMKEIE